MPGNMAAVVPLFLLEDYREGIGLLLWLHVHLSTAHTWSKGRGYVRGSLVPRYDFRNNCADELNAIN